MWLVSLGDTKEVGVGLVSLGDTKEAGPGLGVPVRNWFRTVRNWFRTVRTAWDRSLVITRLRPRTTIPVRSGVRVYRSRR